MAKLNEQTSLNSKTPWLNADGTKKTDNEIEKLGTSWSLETWNQYLDSSVGSLEDSRLSFVPNMDTDEILEKSTVIDYLENGKYYEDIETALVFALFHLSKTERAVIRGSFWMMLSDKEIAKALNKSHQNVRYLKSTAIKKLRSILSSEDLLHEISQLKSSDRFKTVLSFKKHRITEETLTLS